jgi:hypothetical protein
VAVATPWQVEVVALPQAAAAVLPLGVAAIDAPAVSVREQSDAIDQGTATDKAGRADTVDMAGTLGRGKTEDTAVKT